MSTFADAEAIVPPQSIASPRRAAGLPLIKTPDEPPET
ncbi:hypothetical protein VCHC59A1_0962A, partial [Vibrio cholerae HC-59A1]